MDPRVEKRLGLKILSDRVVSAEEAAALIPNGAVARCEWFYYTCCMKKFVLYGIS
ncbi:hypothetical protein UACE39S_01753 [Ureibacillus acetophenoni]